MNQFSSLEIVVAQNQPGWHHENIKAEIRKKFGSLRQFGVIIGASKPLVTMAIKHPNSSSRVELAIAKALGSSPQEIWPERWVSAEQPTSFRSKPGKIYQRKEKS